MPPSRKRRNDRQPDAEPRPSPHRPDDLGLGRQSNQHMNDHNSRYSQGSRENSYGGTRGARRGARSGTTSRLSASQNPTETPASQQETPDTQAAASNPSETPNTPRPSSVMSTTPAAPATQAATPAPNAELPQSQPAASSQPAEKLIRGPPAPYYYEVITDERVTKWAESGKQTVIQCLIDELATDDYKRFCPVFQELVHAGTEGRIEPEEAGSVFKLALESAAESEIDREEIFLDTLAVILEFDQRHPKIRPLLLSTGIAAEKVRENLESGMLETLGIVRSHFQRIQTRKQTNVLYRQANYNLLREESEGYSKLITTLFDISSMKETPGNIAEETFQKVLALIGSFNLDAGRVLDVTLDLFATLLVRHFRFFVKYLRASQYWPRERVPENLVTQADPLDPLPMWAQPGSDEWITTPEERDRINQIRVHRDADFWARAREIGIEAFFELGGRRVLGPEELHEALVQDGEADDTRALETRKWIEETKTLPPRGNSVAAQLLGFKLRLYSTPGRGPSDVLPEILIFLAALLIKIGFISLRDLYTHLYPDDQSMNAVKEAKTKEKEQRDAAKRGGGAMNALARAGALADDTIPPSVARAREADSKPTGLPKSEPTEESDPKESVPEPSDQKIELLKSLLLQGAIPEALYLLGRFPWLYDVIPDLAQYFHRILHHCLSAIYEPLMPLINHESINQLAKAASSDQSGVPRGGLRQKEIGARRSLKWAKLDARHGGDNGADYSFYFEEWADSIPVCQSVDDVFTLCQTLLGFSGIKIGEDEVLLKKLIRIGKWSVSQDPSEGNQSRWIDLLKRVICPAFSLTKANTSLAVELYDLLSMFPTHIRWSVYSEWFQGTASRQADVALAFKQSEHRTKSLMKRMSTTNVEEMSQALAKVACSNPGIVFLYALTQIESYNNLANVVIDCGQYFTDMSFDVFAWAIVSTLGRTGRKKVTDTGYEASAWLISLSSFIGKIFERYPNMPTLPILQYVLDSLRKDEFMDLRVLKELIINMAGIIPEADLSDLQTRCLAGGPSLRAYTLRRIQDVRHLKHSSAERLTQSFTLHNLTGSFVVSIAQNRQTSVDNAGDTTLKVVSENFDDINIILGQFLELLNNNLSVEELCSRLPSLVDLIVEYGIDSEIAFMISRRAILHKIRQYDLMQRGTNGYSKDVDMDREERETLTDGAVTASSDCHPVLKELVSSLLPVVGEDLDATINLTFYATFWALSVNDIFFDQPSYDSTIRFTKERVDEIGRELPRLEKTETKKRAQLEQERAYLNKTQMQIKDEMAEEFSHCEDVTRRLRGQKATWFKDRRGNFRVLLETIWQQCFLPRIMLSPLDSYYCWRMFWFLHSEGVTGFSTMHFLNILFSPRTLENLIFQCTAREAENLGRFAYQVLRKLAHWQADEDLYRKEAHGVNEELVGFARGIKDGKPERLVSFSEFRNLHYTWHRQIFEAVLACIKPQGEYMHMKNAISFVKSIGEFWPRADWMASKLHDLAVSLAEDEKPSTKDNPGVGLERGDLSVALASLQATLARSRPKWISQKEFRTGERPPAKETLTSAQNAGARNSPRPESGRAMNPETPSFQPHGPSSGTRINTRTHHGEDRGGRVDVEDGELADSPTVNRDPQGSESARPHSVEELKQKALASMASKRDASSSSSGWRDASDNQGAVSGTEKDTASRPARAETVRRQPLPPQRPPPSGPSDRYGEYPRTVRPGETPPARRPYGDARADARGRPYSEVESRAPRPDIMADRERSSMTAGRLPPPSTAPDRSTASRQDDYRGDGSRLPDRRDTRVYTDERGRPPPRLEGRSDGLHEASIGPERLSRYEESRYDERREASRRSSPRGEGSRHGPGAEPVHDANSVNADRAMAMDKVSTAPYRDPYGDAKGAHMPRPRQQTPPGAHPESRYPPRDDLYNSMRPPLFDSRDRLPPPDYIPNGPRGVAGRTGPRGSYEMEAPRGPMAPRGGSEAGGPRYQDLAPPSRHQDPNYGRLTREPVDAGGPRGARGFGGSAGDRHDYGPSASTHGSASAEGPPMPAPSGPGRRTSDRFGSSSGPATPESSSMHPSRMRQMDHDGRSGPSPRAAGSSFPEAPNGPRTGVPLSTQPSPASAPTGPASTPGSGPTTDRRENQRRYAGLQDTLAQGSPGPGGRRSESGPGFWARGPGTPSNGAADAYNRPPPAPAHAEHSMMPPVQRYGGAYYDPSRSSRPRGHERDEPRGPPLPPPPPSGQSSAPLPPAAMRQHREGGADGDDARGERRSDYNGRKRQFPSEGPTGAADAERGKRTRRGGA